MVCFWYDFRESWKIAWKREEAASAAVVGVWDMMGACEGGQIYGMGDGLGENEDCEHWAEGAPPHGKAPNKLASANEERRACP